MRLRTKHVHIRTRTGAQLKLIALTTTGTTLTINAPSGVIEGDPFSVTGMLTRNDTGARLPGETLSISVDGIPISSGQTNATGSYSFIVTIFIQGDHDITVSYSGGACVTACEVSCQTACQQSCQTSCETTSCETTCLQSCQTSCERGISCETNCEKNLACEI